MGVAHERDYNMHNVSPVSDRGQVTSGTLRPQVCQKGMCIPVSRWPAYGIEMREGGTWTGLRRTRGDGYDAGIKAIGVPKKGSMHTCVPMVFRMGVACVRHWDRKVEKGTRIRKGYVGDRRKRICRAKSFVHHSWAQCDQGVCWWYSLGLWRQLNGLCTQREPAWRCV